MLWHHTLKEMHEKQKVSLYRVADRRAIILIIAAIAIRTD